MKCDSLEAQSLSRSKQDYNWFLNKCVTSEEMKPVVYVNGANFYFNITKSAVFENIVFDGINQFA